MLAAISVSSKPCTEPTRTPAEHFKIDEPLPLFKANYNIVPTQNVVAIRLKGKSAKRE
jgi:hypothetical protein